MIPHAGFNTDSGIDHGRTSERRTYPSFGGLMTGARLSSRGLLARASELFGCDSELGHGGNFAELFAVETLKLIELQQALLHETGKHKQDPVELKLRATFDQVPLDAEIVVELPEGIEAVSVGGLLLHCLDQALSRALAGLLKGRPGDGLLLL